MSVTPQTHPLRPESRLRSIVDFYVTTMRTAIQAEFQYRARDYIYILGMVAEPVIYLVVWSTIADQSGGAVSGLTAGDFAAYYIVWTLVRKMNIVFTPYGWEWRIREGELSGQLLRPLHPIHYDIAWFAGGKVPWHLYCLPIAVVLSLVFDPTLDIRPAEVAVFAVAIWGAYLIRTFNQSALGMRLLLDDARRRRSSSSTSSSSFCSPAGSSRCTLMPDWVQTIAWFLPFRWTFYFPIETLVGDLSNQELLAGLGMQLFWTLVGIASSRSPGGFAIRRYSAVGNDMTTLRVALLHLRDRGA